VLLLLWAVSGQIAVAHAASPRTSRVKPRDATGLKTAARARAPRKAKWAGQQKDPVRPSSPELTARATESIGSLSVGHPHAGFLLNAVRMPAGDQWIIGLPNEAYGTDETIRDLVHCIKRVNEQFPNTPRIVVGTISARGGGPLPPHKSHRTGRDADVALYYKDGKWRYNEPAGAHNLDRARTWAFLRAVITETDVEFVLVDRAVQALLEEHALAIGEDAAWVSELFHGKGPYVPPIVKHVPGHTAHMHVRFVSPVARERGRLAYDRLVEQGHIVLPSRDVMHTVASGETLTELAAEYGTTPLEIQKQNQLSSSDIEAGQRLRIKKREHVRDARAAVVVPQRKLPGRRDHADDAATRAALEELERQLDALE
jgi:penicillin-insensitive murein endopeptidase